MVITHATEFLDDVTIHGWLQRSGKFSFYILPAICFATETSAADARRQWAL